MRQTNELTRLLSTITRYDERATEIMAQIDPQYAFWSSIVYLHRDRTRRTFELINIVLQFCVYVEMRFKHALACYRPVEYNAQVQPMITTPGHGTFPMGHATQAYAVAHVLKVLLDLNPAKLAHALAIEQLQRQAARITTNRVIAGVHFPVDSIAGRMLGTALGEYFVGRCLGSTASTGRTFDAGYANNHALTDFNPFSPDQGLGAGKFYHASTQGPISKSTVMEHLWGEARKEWARRFPFP